MTTLPLDNDSMLLSIYTEQTKQRETLNNQTKMLEEIRSTLKEYMLIREADIKFNAQQTTINALQTQVNEIQAWRLTSSLSTQQSINTVQASGKQDVNASEKMNMSQLLGKQGAILLFVGSALVSILLYLIQTFVTASHLFGK